MCGGGWVCVCERVIEFCTSVGVWVCVWRYAGVYIVKAQTAFTVTVQAVWQGPTPHPRVWGVGVYIVKAQTALTVYIGVYMYTVRQFLP